MHRALTETHLTVMQPWGSYTVFEDGDRYRIKRIVVQSGARTLGCKMHHHRSGALGRNRRYSAYCEW